MTRAQTAFCIVMLGLAMTGSQAWMALHDGWLSQSTNGLSHFLLSFLVALLVECDRKIRGRSAPFEFAAFVFFTWPITAPYYFFTVMRWRGLALGLGLVLLAVAPDLVIIFLQPQHP